MRLEDRFWPKVQKTETCWLWTGAVDSSGYGLIEVGGCKNRATLRAHRVACMLKGVRIAGLVVRHECNVKLCVRVAKRHAQAGTQKQNMRDRELAGNTLRGSSFHNAVMTKEKAAQVLEAYDAGVYRSVRELGRAFGLASSTVYNLVAGVSGYRQELS